MSRTLAFIQARMSSTRFPGKVLQPIQGLASIVYMARRASMARLLDGVVVLTSTTSSDDPLAECVQAAGIPLFRGDLDDVLKRFVDAARHYDAQEIVRLTGDCPLIDPAIIDAVITARRNAAVDYSSNIDPPTFPDGLDVECCTRAALEHAGKAALRRGEREHVTLWMRSDEAGLSRTNVRAIANLSHVRLTVDYPDDLEVVRRIVAEAATGAPDLFDILRILSGQPDILTLNAHSRNEALALSPENLHPHLIGAKP
jgi:spore coat polysaccharide biosynthesis protein SpsF (cytidylyltransferase family)